MTATNGKIVAAYRQSGGIVIYDVDSRERRLLSETGGPGDVDDELVAAQGLAIEGGLGGGIALLPLDGSEPEVVSEAGDSPKLWAGRVFWQELRGEMVDILARDVGGGVTVAIVNDGVNPSVHDHLIAWTDRASRPSVYVMDLRSGERRTISERGIFPDTKFGRTAFLEHAGPDDEAPASRYDLVVYDWLQNTELLRVQEVGFPTGRGPLLTENTVVWEMADERGITQLWEQALPD